MSLSIKLPSLQDIETLAHKVENTVQTVANTVKVVQGSGLSVKDIGASAINGAVAQVKGDVGAAYLRNQAALAADKSGPILLAGAGLLLLLAVKK